MELAVGEPEGLTFAETGSTAHALQDFHPQMATECLLHDLIIWLAFAHRRNLRRSEDGLVKIDGSFSLCHISIMTD